MRKLIYLICALSWTHTIVAQKVPFELTVPKSATKSTELLAAFLTKDVSGDSAKARVIYQWVTNNIVYDYVALKKGKGLTFQTGRDVLKTRKALCQGYAYLYRELLNHAGITTAIVEGNTAHERSDSMAYASSSDHMWLLMKLNGTWYVSDPTWDAGYIGRIPKHLEAQKKLEKRNKKREAKLRKWSLKKQEKKKKRWAKRDAKKQDENALGDTYEVSNKIGFVAMPRLDYFMQNPDTFVKTHLPVLPEFQLRTYPLSMPVFYAKETKWESALTIDTAEQVNYNAKVDQYAAKPIHHQWMQVAEQGLSYNPYGYTNTAIHFHNYIGIHLSESFRKNYGQLPKSELTEYLPKLREMNDSLKLYIKYAKEIEKEASAFAKKTISKESKVFKASDKAASSSISKVISSQEKTIDQLKKNGKTLSDDLKSVINKQAAILEDYPTANTAKAFDESSIPSSFVGWKDSLFTLVTQFEVIRHRWDSIAHSDTVLDTRFFWLKEAYEWSYTNMAILSNAPTHYDTDVISQDSLVFEALEELLVFHKEVYPQIMYPDQAMNAYKAIEKHIKSGAARMKKYAQSYTDWKFIPVNNYLMALQYSLLEAMKQDMFQASQDRRQLLAIESHYKGYYEQVKDHLDEEKACKVKNTEYQLELNKIDDKRTKEMFDSMKKNSEEYEEYFKKMLDGK